jgi:hypothetical protein
MARPCIVRGLGDQPFTDWNKVNVTNHLRQERMLLQKCGPISLLKQVTVLTQFAVHIPSVLTGQSLHETAERLIGYLQREMDFTRCPAECINSRPAAPDASFDKFGESRVVGRLQKDIPPFVTVQDYIMESAGNVQTS